MTERLKTRNMPTSPNEWDFVKDVSLERTTDPRKVISKDGKLETIRYTYLDNSVNRWVATPDEPSSNRPFSIDQLSALSGSTDKGELISFQIDSDRLKNLIAEKIGDKDDHEKINYYLSNPDKAVHDLVDAPQKFRERAEKGDLIPEQIVSANEHKYNELLNRLAILEQNYPNLKNRGAAASPNIPRDVDREWILVKRYLELLSEPVTNPTNKNKYELTDSGEIIKDGRGSSVGKIAAILESYSKKNKTIINENIPLPKKVNPHKGTVEWLAKIDSVDSLNSLNALEKDFKEALSPINTQYTLRAKYILNDKVSDIIKEKRTKLELESTIKTRDSFIEKYKDHINDLTEIKPLDAQLVYSQVKQNLETITKDIEAAQKELKRLEKELDNTPSYRRLSSRARSLKRQVNFQKDIIKNLSGRKVQLQQQYDLAHDRMQFYKANAEVAKLSRPTS